MDLVCKTCGISFSIEHDAIDEGQKSVICENCDEDVPLPRFEDEPDSRHVEETSENAKPTSVGALAAAEEAQRADEEANIDEEAEPEDDGRAAKRSPKLEVVNGLDEPDSIADESDPAVIELKESKPAAKPPTTWHVFLDGDWRGPYEAEEIASLVERGRLDRESKCWRDGLDDWSSLVDFEELSTEIAAKTSSRRLANPPPPNNARGRRKGKRKDIDEKPLSPEEREQQRASAYKSEADVADRTTGTRGGRDGEGDADLFEPYDEEGDREPPSTRTSSSPSSSLKARAADSVLFDRYRLEAFSEGEGSYPPYVEEYEDEDRGDSGLIDIKTLAAEVERSPKDTVVDELVNVGGGGFGALTLGHDANAKPEQPRDKLFMAVLFMGFVILIAVGVQVYLSIRGDTDSDEQPMMVIMLPPDPNGEVETLIVRPGVGTQRVKGRPDLLLGGMMPPEIESESDDIQATETEEEPAADDDSASDEEVLEDILGIERDEEDGSYQPEEEYSDQSREERREARERERSTENEQDVTPEKARTVEPRDPEKQGSTTGSEDRSSTGDNSEGLYGPSKGREIWEPNESSKKQGPSGDPSLPESLTKVQVQAGMNTVANSVRRCAVGKSGTIMIRVTINGETGRVTSTRVSGSFAGTPEGSCAARATRRARFPRFSQKSLTIQYPFQVF